MNSVQQKIPCVYETGVVDEPSNKRPHQPFKVMATRNLSKNAWKDEISSARITEKLDGTCCLVTQFEGQPCLWARHDRKPTKAGERRYAQYKRMKEKSETEGKTDHADFQWDSTKDFKEAPKNWLPADGHKVQNGIVIPDRLAHTPGWVPVLNGSRQHCWHLSAINLSLGIALILSQNENDDSGLLLQVKYMSQLCGQTLELIGTNINGNPYNLGTKKFPFHFLVPHGGLTLNCPSPTDYDSIVSWMTSDSESNQVEGIVWHCHNGQMHKLHRHHLNMPWPDRRPMLCQRRVKVQVPVEEIVEFQSNAISRDLFVLLSCLNGQEFDSLAALSQTLIDQCS